jgi:hypothetical protein
MGFGNFHRAPPGGAPVQNLALLDQVVHVPHGLAVRCVRIGAVTEMQVEIVHLQALQGLVAGFGDLVSAQAVPGGRGLGAGQVLI